MLLLALIPAGTKFGFIQNWDEDGEVRKTCVAGLGLGDVASGVAGACRPYCCSI